MIGRRSMLDLVKVGVTILVTSLFAGTYFGWGTNAAALQVKSRITSVTDCFAGDGLEWKGGAVPESASPYLRTVASAAGAPAVAFPAAEEWDRDPRLYDWFRAQALIQQHDYAASLPYLK